MKNDRETAGHCDDVFADLWKLFREQGSLRLMYAAANLMGLTQAQPPKPLQPLEETLQARLARVLPNS